MLSIAEVLGYQMVSGLVEDQAGPLARRFVREQRDDKGRRVPATADTPAEQVEVVRYSFRYKEGDRAVYFPADTVLTDEWATKFEVKHLLKSGNRVGRACLRGEPSFGLLAEIPEGQNWSLGENVAAYYGAVKYVPPPRNDPGDFAPYDSDIDPHFVGYTDIQNGKLLYESFVPGEEVVATEKIHGCLAADTLVMLANGEERPISELSIGDSVLSLNDATDELQPKRVLDVIERKPAGTWVEMEFDDGRVIRCTDDHKFLTARGWVAAVELTLDDEVVDAFEMLVKGST
jgi:hypothetical protein